MILATGNKGFTLIEVLLAIALLSFGLVWILEGYGSILNTVKMAQNLTEGSLILHERMAEQKLRIQTGEAEAGTESGSEGLWQWSTETKVMGKEGLYELRGEVHRKGTDRSVSLETYVQQ